MKIIILISLCLCLLATADKSHKHQGNLLKSGPGEHKKHSELQTADKDETDLKIHTEIKPEESEPKAGEQTDETKPAAGTGRKHRQKHHGKNKKGGISNTEAHNGARSRKLQQSKPNKHNSQRSHNNNKQHGRKHGRGKQTQ